MNRIIACLLKLILAVSITGSLSANWLSSESMTAFSNPEIENLMAQDSLPQRLKILEHLLSTSQSDSLIFEESAYALVLTCIQMENDPMLARDMAKQQDTLESRTTGAELLAHNSEPY